MSFSIPPSLSSPQDVASLQAELRVYADWLSHQTIKQRVSGTPATATPPATSEATAAILRDWAAQTPASAASLEALQTAIAAAVAAAPRLTITLAAPAPAPLRASLTAWCREHIAADALVSFRFNATLLGGMVIVAGSRIFDWSWRRQILEHKADIAGILRRV